MPISSFSFTCDKRDEIDVTDRSFIEYDRHILRSYRIDDFINEKFSVTTKTNVRFEDYRSIKRVEIPK